jgi:hypothetical protein
MTYEIVLHEYPEIEGLRWIRNVDIPSGPNSSILLGGKVTTLIIRRGGYKTEYAVWGIHVGTDDQLTFVTKADDKPIVVRFVDCRRHSSTAGAYFEIETTPDASKRLVIPRGVAHLPTNCNGLLTLNTPALYWDFRRRGSMKLELDVINVERDRDTKKFPRYDVCRFKVPNWAYPVALAVYKDRYDPRYRAPFVFDRNGELYVLRKRIQEDDIPTPAQVPAKVG